MNSEEAEPRYSGLGMVAGAGVGLLSGALLFALLLPPPTDVFAIVSTHALMGLGPVFAGTSLVGLVVLRLLKRHRARPSTAVMIVFGLSLGSRSSSPRS